MLGIITARPNLWLLYDAVRVLEFQVIQYGFK